MYRPHHGLIVWQRSITFVQQVYTITATFPREERYGLISQMRRAAVSIPSNIAEGAGRKTHGETVQFLSFAQGSAAELETQIIIAQALTYLSTETGQAILSELTEISKMITGLSQSPTYKRPGRK
jgi:four helix bundle protein